MAHKKKLRIGLLSAQIFEVPAIGYPGGLEQVVWDLAYSLDKLGHEVTLFAPDGSQPQPHGKLVETGKAIHHSKVDWVEAERQAYRVVSDMLPSLDLDVLHGHTHFGFEYYAKACNPELPVTRTCHDHLNTINSAWFDTFKGKFKLNLLAVSNFIAQAYTQKGFYAKCCHNGINLEKYPFKKEKSDRFLFLGRIISNKAPHIAIAAAKKAGAKLDIIGTTSFVNDPKYVNFVEHLCDGKQIRFIGEVDDKTKIDFLSNARGLLVPSVAEPFGLVCVEAMACGTAPIALAQGAFSEIIVDGQSGFVCESVDDMVQKIKEVNKIQPQNCRNRAGYFSREQMAERYVSFYEELTAKKNW
jgi:glycosyltransferase involved in cell wall biosynthesis